MKIPAKILWLAIELQRLTCRKLYPMSRKTPAAALPSSDDESWMADRSKLHK